MSTRDLKFALHVSNNLLTIIMLDMFKCYKQYFLLIIIFSSQIWPSGRAVRVDKLHIRNGLTHISFRSRSAHTILNLHSIFILIPNGMSPQAESSHLVKLNLCWAVKCRSCKHSNNHLHLYRVETIVKNTLHASQSHAAAAVWVKNPHIEWMFMSLILFYHNNDFRWCFMSWMVIGGGGVLRWCHF